MSDIQSDVIRLPFKVTNFDEEALVALDRNFKDIEYYLADLQKYTKREVAGSIEALQEQSEFTNSLIHQTEDSILLQVKDSDRKIRASIGVTAEQILLEVADLAEGLQTQINQNAGSISLVASSVGGLEDRVDAAELLITPSAIVSTVRSSQAYAGDLSSLQTQINQNAGNISLQASSISGLGTRVSSAESTLSIQAGQISSKVSETDFTGSTIVSKINQTAASVKIEAKNIDLTGITRVYAPNNSNNYIELGGNYSDANFVYGGNTFFTIRNEITGVSLRSFGKEILTFESGNQTTAPRGNWNFSNAASVTGLNAIATFG